MMKLNNLEQRILDLLCVSEQPAWMSGLAIWQQLKLSVFLTGDVQTALERLLGAGLIDEQVRRDESGKEEHFYRLHLRSPVRRHRPGRSMNNVRTHFWWLGPQHKSHVHSR
jgi:predicted transcriptional regulator